MLEPQFPPVAAGARFRDPTPLLFSWLTCLIPGIQVFSFPYLGLISDLLEFVTYIRDNICVLLRTHSKRSAVSTHFRMRSITPVAAAPGAHAPACNDAFQAQGVVNRAAWLVSGAVSPRGREARGAAGVAVLCCDHVPPVRRRAGIQEEAPADS